MKTSLTVIGTLWLLSMLLAVGLCEPYPADSLDSRLAENREAFGLAIRLETPDAEKQAVDASKSDQAPAQSATGPSSSGDLHEPAEQRAGSRVPAKPAVSVREVTGSTQLSTGRSAKSSSGRKAEAQQVESGVLSRVETPGEVREQSRRPDKIALLAEMGEERKPAHKGAGDAAKTVLGTLLKLALVLVLAYLTILALKWISGRRDLMPHGSQNLRIVDTLRLSTGSSLHLINAEGKRLLIGCSSGQVSLLQEFETGDATEPGEQPAGRFAEYLEKYSAGSSAGSPSRRIAGLLRDCTAYLRKRQSSAVSAGKLGAGEKHDS